VIRSFFSFIFRCQHRKTTFPRKQTIEFGGSEVETYDHVIVFNEASLYRHVKSFVTYYHESRTHLSLSKDSPGRAAARTWTDRSYPASRRSPSPVRTARSLTSVETIPVRNGDKCESN
jgi:hypothetical protein